MIGLALSGGGSRAIAFHLGCLRALNDRGVLQKTSVLSAVSGGSVIAAMYAYWNDSFKEFDHRVLELLRRGLLGAILRHFFFSPELLSKILITNLISSPVALVARLLKMQPPLRRWASRTDALEAALRDLFGSITVGQVKRPNLDVILNACELRTGTAFRFGNQRSGSWRFGEIKDNNISAAHAVACSAAHPVFFPAFDRVYSFGQCRERVIITDGGLYDNLGISCLEPGRNQTYSLHVYNTDYILCCDAGYGQFSGNMIPYGFISRTNAAFASVFRKNQDSSFKRLYLYKQMGLIKGFVLSYLGQMDKELPTQPPDLVRREDIFDYPTDFSPMNEKNINLLTRRGEQLTRILLSYHCPEIGQ
jgi:NTE family protein